MAVEIVCLFIAGILVILSGVGVNKLYVKFFVPKRITDGKPKLNYKHHCLLGNALIGFGALGTVILLVFILMYGPR